MSETERDIIRRVFKALDDMLGRSGTPQAQQEAQRIFEAYWTGGFSVRKEAAS